MASDNNSNVHRRLRVQDDPHGADVKRAQVAINQRGASRGFPKVTVDGVYGPETDRVGRAVAKAIGVKTWGGGLGPHVQKMLRHPDERSKKEKARADRWRKQQSKKPLREKAYAVASNLVGVMEQGGNNVGPQVSALIREGGGIPGQAWCGWFQAVCYKRAGSKAVDWHWGAVRLLWPLSGVSRTSKPQRGDLVRFTFDHVGMFVRDRGDGTIETVEGNTGASGAVSDSSTGGDGVYRKVRSKSLVQDYLHITR